MGTGVIGLNGQINHSLARTNRNGAFRLGFELSDAVLRHLGGRETSIVAALVLG